MSPLPAWRLLACQHQMGLPCEESLHRPSDELRDSRMGPAVMPAGLRQEKAGKAGFVKVVVCVLGNQPSGLPHDGVGIGVVAREFQLDVVGCDWSLEIRYGDVQPSPEVERVVFPQQVERRKLVLHRSGDPVVQAGISLEPGRHSKYGREGFSLTTETMQTTFWAFVG